MLVAINRECSFTLETGRWWAVRVLNDRESSLSWETTHVNLMRRFTPYEEPKLRWRTFKPCDRTVGVMRAFRINAFKVRMPRCPAEVDFLDTSCPNLAHVPTCFFFPLHIVLCTKDSILSRLLALSWRLLALSDAFCRPLATAP